MRKFPWMLWALVAVLVGSGCGESAEVTQPSATPPTSSPQAAITAHVSSNVALSAEQGAKVFVFLRRPGERMPLGVLQLDPSQLPQAVSFSAPQGEGSDFEVVARFSPKGSVTRAAGDLEAIAQVALESGRTAPAFLELGEASAVAATVRTLPANHPPVGGHGLTAPAASEKQITARVLLAADTVGEIAAESAVFGMARQPEGMPMPLAVKRLPVSALPATVTLGDADAMMPMHRLSAAQDIVVFARLSRAGTADAAAGDLESEKVPLSQDDLPVSIELRLDRSLP